MAYAGGNSKNKTVKFNSKKEPVEHKKNQIPDYLKLQRANERRTLNIRVNYIENSKPIEMLMSALAALPSVNVDSLIDEKTKKRDAKNDKGKKKIIDTNKKPLLVRNNFKIKKRKSITKKDKIVNINFNSLPPMVKKPTFENVKLEKRQAKVKIENKVEKRKQNLPKQIKQPERKNDIKDSNRIIKEEKIVQAKPKIPTLVFKVKPPSKSKTDTVDPKELIIKPSTAAKSEIVGLAPRYQSTGLKEYLRTQNNITERKRSKSLGSKKPSIAQVPASVSMAFPPLVPGSKKEASVDSINQNKRSSLLISSAYLQKNLEMDKEYQSVCSYVSKTTFRKLKEKADIALRHEKTFALGSHTNGYQSVRKYFLSNGWIERFAHDDEKTVYRNLVAPPDSEALVLSKLISHKEVNLLWTDGAVNFAVISSNTFVNKFPGCFSYRSLSSKTGLLQMLERQCWTYNPNFSFVKHPRTVTIRNDQDMRHFASIYRVNACVAMILNFLNCWDNGKDISSEFGVVPMDSIDFAIQRVCEFVTFEEGTDVDQWNISLVSEDDWILFLLRFYDMTHFNAKFKSNDDFDIPKLVVSCRYCINRVKQIWPDIDDEGFKNLWLVKPGASSCGRGIKIYKSLVEIVNHCQPGHTYIIQKYIERPMVIYKTKFDIRQWFLVTSVTPLVVYMYEFCSKEFSLVNLHEQIHLCNNSVQCRYSNGLRNPDLPEDNMWDSDQFLIYLKNRKLDDKWFAITLPGMRKGIVGALLAAQEDMINRKNSFNLYGADFMLTEDFVPWLIEINGGPCLRNTTTVTSRLCPMVIQDSLNSIYFLVSKHFINHFLAVLKKKNKDGTNNTGRFKLLYDQKPFPPPIKQTEMKIIGEPAKIYTQSTSPKTTPKVSANELERKDDSSCPVTFECRSLNYDLLSLYKKKIDPISKHRVNNHSPQRVPMGPGSILSRYDNNYLGTPESSNSRNGSPKALVEISSKKPVESREEKKID